MRPRILLVAYPYAGTGANMLRYRSLSYYLLKKNYVVDVVGYYDLKEQLPQGIKYYQIRRHHSAIAILVFFRLFLNYLYLLESQSFFSYIRRVGLASCTYISVRCLLKQNEYESCLVGIHPWAFYLIIPLIKKHLRTVIDIGDPLYKNAIMLNSAHPSNFRLEQQALGAADYVVTMNEPTIDIMTKEMGISKDKVEFISPAMNIESYRPKESRSFPIHNPLTIIYSGSLYQGYRDLNEVQPAIDMIGNVILDVFTNKYSDCKSTNCVRYHDWISHRDLLQKYQEYDVILFIDNSFGYQVPSKIFEIIAQNKPVLFVYDQRNTYFYELLKGQMGIIFVENKRENIVKTLKEITSKNTLNTCYTFDMSDYSEEIVNTKIMATLTK